MSTRPELDVLIDSRIRAWSNIPCPLLMDNSPGRNTELSEWMRLTVDDGFSFAESTSGLQDVTGSTAAHPFILVFDIFTPINTQKSGTAANPMPPVNPNGPVERRSEIAQAIMDHWAFWVWRDENVHLDAATYSRVGEEKSIYHSTVIVNGARYETLAARN